MEIFVSLLYNIIQLIVIMTYSKMSEEEIVGVKTILGIYFTKGQIEEITVNFPILKLPEMVTLYDMHSVIYFVDL